VALGLAAVVMRDVAVEDDAEDVEASREAPAEAVSA
jgi:hypothetical protein